MLKRLRKWWDGTPIEVNKPGDGIFFIGDFREFHWSASACRALLGYARENHRWLIGTAIALIALVLARH